MELIVQPIGYVRAARRALDDDYWGGATAMIALDASFPESALDGIAAF